MHSAPQAFELSTRRTAGRLALGVLLAAALVARAGDAAAQSTSFDAADSDSEAAARSRARIREFIQVNGAPTFFMLGYMTAASVGVAGVLGPENNRPYTYNVIPLAGPLFSGVQCGTLGTEAARGECATTGYWAYAITATSVQVAGVAMMFLSAALARQPSRALAAAPPPRTRGERAASARRERSDGTAALEPAWVVGPTSGAAGHGLALSVRF